MLDRYIAWLYFRHTALILAALTTFFVGMDTLGAASKLPDSANLILLFALFRAARALDIILPLSLVFGAIATNIRLVRSNELVALYSIGASRLKTLKPFVVVSLAISCAYIALCSTQFVYLSDKADAIKQKRDFSTITQDLFIRYDNRFIYIKELLPLQNEARGVDILEVIDGDLSRFIRAKKGVFKDGVWLLSDVSIITKPSELILGDSGIVAEERENMEELRGFRPDVMDTIYEQKFTYSLIDAARAWILFANQDINTYRIRSILYATIVFPLFAPLFVSLVFAYAPVSPRFFNMAMFSSVSILSVLVAWGALYSLAQAAKNGAASPEAALLLPFALSAAIVALLLKRKL
ncbi:MAG: LptF/LptG family permease [Helicobacteraceae bacterium]|jgi:lipopolysaccharide export system permease protein|nr:LptF/LptG family permease [Helicobacteraceae bacterium]